MGLTKEKKNQRDGNMNSFIQTPPIPYSPTGQHKKIDGHRPKPCNLDRKIRILGVDGPKGITLRNELLLITDFDSLIFSIKNFTCSNTPYHGSTADSKEAKSDICGIQERVYLVK